MAEELLWLRCEAVACVSKYLSNIPTSVKLLQILTSSGSIFSIIAIKWIIGSQYNFITDEKYCHFTPLKHFLELLRSRFANILPVNRAEIHKSRPVPQNTWNAVYGVFYWAICTSHAWAVACRAHFGSAEHIFWEHRAVPLSQQCPQQGHGASLKQDTGHTSTVPEAQHSCTCRWCLQQPQMIFPITSLVLWEGRAGIPAPAYPCLATHLVLEQIQPLRPTWTGRWHRNPPGLMATASGIQSWPKTLLGNHAQLISFSIFTLVKVCWLNNFTV